MVVVGFMKQTNHVVQIAYVERVDTFFGGPDCARDDDTGQPVLHPTHFLAIRSLAEDVVASSIAMLDAADDANTSDEERVSLYGDLCRGGPLASHYVCAVQIFNDGRILDEEGNVYWPQHRSD